jgi:hypothetical protein
MTRELSGSASSAANPGREAIDRERPETRVVAGAGWSSMAGDACLALPRGRGPPFFTNP